MADERSTRAGWLVAAGGAAGGAINALLCLLGIPVQISDGSILDLQWHIVPAGAVHGAILAAAAYYGARWWAPRNILLRLGGAIGVGWVGGYLSWNSLRLSLGHGFLTPREVFSDGIVQAILGPLDFFGAVTALLYLVLVVRRPSTRSFWASATVAVTAGVLGSLHVWFDYSHAVWYLSLIHGTIWGLAVAAALSVGTDRRDEAR